MSERIELISDEDIDALVAELVTEDAFAEIEDLANATFAAA